VGDWTDLLAYDFMRRALLAGFAVSLLCSVVSVFVLLKRMAFIGSGIAHAALGGVAVGLFAGLDPAATALGVCVATALGIGWISERGRIHEDAAIGILTAGIMALGVVLIGFARAYQGDLFSYLFGNILAVGRADLIELAVIAVVVLGFLALYFKELLFVAFDEEVARVTGIPARALSYGLLVAVACTVVAAIQVVGLILASALLVVPAATGYQLARNWRGILLVSLATGWLAVLGGLLLSYRWDVASGGTIVLLLVALFFAAFLVSPRRPGRG
jgi:zinc transport system permease protein